MQMFGEVSEWFKVQTWNVCAGETLPWVRIPPFPPFYFLSSFSFLIKKFVILSIYKLQTFESIHIIIIYFEDIASLFLLITLYLDL